MVCVCWIHCFRRGFTNATSKGPMSTTVTNNVKMMYMLSFFTYIGLRDDSTYLVGSTASIADLDLNSMYVHISNDSAFICMCSHLCQGCFISLPTARLSPRGARTKKVCPSWASTGLRTFGPLATTLHRARLSF